MEEIISLYDQKAGFSYSKREAAEDSFTIGQLIDFLERNYPDKSAKIVVCRNGGYSYSPINSNSLEDW